MASLTVKSGYIQIPHALMRAEPDRTSKVVSDAIHSEEVEVVQSESEWLKIHTKVDGYEGWIERNAVVLRSGDFFAGQRWVTVDRLQAYIYKEQDTEFGGVPLPFESRLKVLEEPEAQQRRWIKVGLVDGSEAFIQRGDIREDSTLLSVKEMAEFSKKFLDVPYAWGGRSSFGYDCSGFVQMLYRQMGVKLPRDSKDQCAWKGFSSVDMEKLERGDLIFFGTAADKVSHVGMYLEGSRFIHSVIKELKPWVHTSSLKDEDWNGSGRLAFRAARRLNRKAEKSSGGPRSVVLAAITGLALSLACRILGKAK